MTTALRAQERLRNILFYGIVLLLIYLVYLIFASFLVPLAWAAVLVIVSYPAYQRLTRRFRPTTASILSTAGITLVLIVPMVFVMIAFVKQGFEAVQTLQAHAADGHFARLNDMWERLQDRFPQAGSEDLGTTLEQYGGMAAEFVASKMGTILKHSAVFLFHIGVTILAIFYFYRDGAPMVERLRELLPFELARRDRILGNVHSLIFASVTSSLVAAAAHGLLGALAFGITGIKAPIFWGVMMGFFSFIPVIGSTLIWLPAAVSLMVGGHMGRGVLLIVFCAVIVGMVDNFIRPWLISGRAEMNGLIVFVSVLGGIEVFGLLGVVLGPVIVATAMSLLDLYAPDAPAGN